MAPGAMAEPKRKKRKKKEQPKLEERRFEPVLGQRSKMMFGLAALGAVLLGAGVYAQFRVQLGIAGAEGPMKNGSYILGAGAIFLAILVLVFPEGSKPVLVGDGGVGIDQGGEGIKRILWCDVDRITLKEGALVVASKALTIPLPLEEHGAAIGWVLREAEERVPDVVEIDDKELATLPKADESAGERQQLPEIQVTGRRCKESGKAISFEPDARLCLRCGEVYMKDAVPEECSTCGAPMEGAAKASTEEA